VAYWPNADNHVAGALQAVPDESGTEIILESTSNGRQGLFYEMCAAAMRGEGEYILVFIPWFWQREYRKPVSEGFQPTADELAYQAAHKLDLEQIVWRRAKIVELNGVHNFRREYPATPEEAFSAEVPGALWKRDQIDNLKVTGKLPHLTRIVVAIDPSGGDKARNDEIGLVVVGMDAQKHGFVLADHSGRYTPETAALASSAMLDQSFISYFSPCKAFQKCIRSCKFASFRLWFLSRSLIAIRPLYLYPCGGDRLAVSSPSP
jgi:hypothetical protein